MKNNLDIMGGELSDAPNEKYKKLFEKFKEIDNLPITEWKVPHILGYFCRKYEEHYQVKYSFKFNSPSPSKCFEVFQIKKLGMLLSSNPVIIKEYIDWIYLNKVKQAKRKLTSISFMTHDSLIQDYKMKYLFNTQKNNINRSTILPNDYQQIFKEIGHIITTYGELAFLTQIEQNDMIKNSFFKLKELGFDSETLTKIT